VTAKKRNLGMVDEETEDSTMVMLDSIFCAMVDPD
jgi:hypothetical protein